MFTIFPNSRTIRRSSCKVVHVSITGCLRGSPSSTWEAEGRRSYVCVQDSWPWKRARAIQTTTSFLGPTAGPLAGQNFMKSTIIILVMNLLWIWFFVLFLGLRCGAAILSLLLVWPLPRGSGEKTRTPRIWWWEEGIVVSSFFETKVLARDRGRGKIFSHFDSI